MIKQREDLIKLLRSVAELSPSVLPNDLRAKAIIWIELLTEDIRINKPHITEQNYPQQTQRFREILDEMYQVHLDKNADYSPYNINGTGIVGLMTRYWDKTARLMNLVGFDIATGNYTGMKENMVKDEDIEKSFIDGSNYGIIARIWLEGKWGK